MTIPNINFPKNLPVSQRVDDIKNQISKNQVTIICGETGSGKTTQLPKICLSLGRGQKKLIGHTQPRRIAARSVANRISFLENRTPFPLIYVTLFFLNKNSIPLVKT